jgi:hypothetical protein
VAISTNYSVTICRWPPTLWTNGACHFTSHWILIKLLSRKRI